MVTQYKFRITGEHACTLALQVIHRLHRCALGKPRPPGRQGIALNEPACEALRHLLRAGLLHDGVTERTPRNGVINLVLRQQGHPVINQLAVARRRVG